MITKPNDVDEYIAQHPLKIQQLLKQVRASIKKAAPDAEETISYGMPAYKQNGILVWFAAHANHIGFYPRVSGIEAFKKELSKYKGAKGSVQFPFDQPIPLLLVTKIIKFRVKENLEKVKSKIKTK